MRQRAQKTRSRDVSQLEQMDPNWLDLACVRVEGKIAESERVISVQAITGFDARPICPQCDSDVAVTKWGIQESRNIKDVERNGKLVLIVLRSQKFRCKECGTKFNPRLLFLEQDGLSRTKRLTNKVKSLLLERRTTSDIAVLTGLSRRTVQQIAQDAAKSLPTPQAVFRSITADGGGHVIQIDNAHPSGGEYTSILLDSKPFHLIEEYNEAAVAAFFTSLEGCEKITCYVSDMAEFLLRRGRMHFRSATIIADPHHVIRRMMECFDAFLKLHEEAMLDEYIRAIESGLLIRPRRPKNTKILKNCASNHRIGAEVPRRPTSAEIRILLHTKVCEATQLQKTAVRYLLVRFPDVRAAYCYLQRVMRLYHTQVSAKEASKALDKFEARLPDNVRGGLDRFLASCRTNRDVICAFWAMGWTNAEIESQNGVIKAINQIAHGLSFEELRRRWLFGNSMSAILEREKERALGKRGGPRKKGIRELRTEPPPEPMPIRSERGEKWLFDQSTQNNVDPESRVTLRTPIQTSFEFAARKSTTCLD